MVKKVTSSTILECVRCGTRFGEQDVRELCYFPSTQVCLHCYELGQSSSYALWCFGKSNVLGPAGSISEYGFNLDAKACRDECPDRKICALFVSGVLGGAMGNRKVVCPFRQDQSMTAKAWMMCAAKGVMIEELVRWVGRQGGDPGRILRIMRSGKRYDVRWLVDEQIGFLKITYQGGGVAAKHLST